MNKKVRLILALILFLLFLFLRGLFEPSKKPDRAPRDIVGHPWLERMPKDQRDQVRQLVLVDKKGHFGASSNSSAYHWNVDILRWWLDGDRLTLVTMQDQEKTPPLEVHVWSCAGDAPSKAFDLCLELKGSSGTSRFYSRDSWRVGSDVPSESGELVRAALEATD
jgi:hypothetical protein